MPAKSRYQKYSTTWLNNPTNTHCHSKTCIKGKRGKTQCRLCCPVGIRDDKAQPLHIHKRDNETGKIQGSPLDSLLEEKLDAGYDLVSGEFLRLHITGPIVWEQFRLKPDGMFIETNSLLSVLTGSHCNSRVMNGEDAGDMVDDYQQNYMPRKVLA
ncbi:hypothetical protein PHMEG_00013094 [Phytophthora megakarya]|uniref:Uncharacterized protein n=1 Tax=Phytophthora megakarya TaxID=4795 RepID=A0A225W760_9STRA|nr:hypothetical protein PHMEG_00013094 [Phytophthora megakarya]